MHSSEIRRVIGVPASAEMLAEECTELAHAALKYARAYRAENYTPVEVDKAYDHMTEEFSDVILAAAVLELTPDLDIMMDKRARWAERIQKANAHK